MGSFVAISAYFGGDKARQWRKYVLLLFPMFWFIVPESMRPDDLDGLWVSALLILIVQEREVIVRWASTKRTSFINPATVKKEIEVFGQHCFLIRNALSMKQQIELFEYIVDKDKTPYSQPRAMFSSPKTLILGDDSPLLKYQFQEMTLVNRMVES